MASGKRSKASTSGGASVPTARGVATSVISRVIKDDAWAAAVLDAELERNMQLDARERALATELVYGTLRVHGFLEGALSANAPRGLGKLDPWTAASMWIAAYQIAFLDRVPAFAAVSEAVGAIRRARGPGLAGFANAVLRKVAAAAPELSSRRDHAAFESLPLWLREALTESLGDDAARELVHVTGAPPIGLRVLRTEDRDAWIERLSAARPDATFERGAVSELAILSRGAGRIADLPGFGAAWTVQEEGSQLIALALGARPGDVVLDACAGRGHKTAILAHAVGKSGAVDAADLHEAKLAVLTDHLAAFGLAPRAVSAVNLSVGLGPLVGPYDRALVDAPCTGTGTLRRRPELALRRRAEDAAAMAALGRSILSRVAQSVRVGGRVVYSVCSVLRAEGPGALAAPEQLGLRPVPFDAGPARALAGEETSLYLLPHVHGTDGYFLASFERI